MSVSQGCEGRRSTTTTRLGRAAAFLTVLSVLAVPLAYAETFVVTKTEDTADGSCNSDCSLREAIIAANAQPGPDTVTVPAGTYVLTLVGANEMNAATGDLNIFDGLTLKGEGAESTVSTAIRLIASSRCPPAVHLN